MHKKLCISNQTGCSLASHFMIKAKRTECGKMKGGPPLLDPRVFRRPGGNVVVKMASQGEFWS